METRMSRSVQSNVIRGCIAVVLLAGLAAFVGNSIFPGIPTWTAVLYALVGGVGAFAVVLAVTVGSLQFRQFVMRKGGTDAQWFWFSSEPEGLLKLREEARSEAHAVQQETDPARRSSGPLSGR
jgi:hypothetical protein